MRYDVDFSHRKFPLKIVLSSCGFFINLFEVVFCPCWGD